MVGIGGVRLCSRGACAQYARPPAPAIDILPSFVIALYIACNMDFL